MYSQFVKLMEMAGVNAAEVSKATGINQSTLSNWKKRNNYISGKNAQLIADYFGVSVGYLMGKETGESPKVILSDEEKEILKAYRSADETTQEMVRRILAYRDAFQSRGLHGSSEEVKHETA